MTKSSRTLGLEWMKKKIAVSEWVHSWIKDEIELFQKNTTSGYDTQNFLMLKNALSITSQGVLNMGVPINTQEHVFQKL